MKINMFYPEKKCHQSPTVAAVVFVASLMVALLAAPAQAAIVYISQSSAGNNALPTDGSAGPLTIPIPAGVSAGRALIASIAVRPTGMTVTVPAGWILMTATDQPAGGVSTGPGGMTLLTYYKVATASEPASYTWTFANPVLGQGGGAVGGILTFSGVDTSASPIDVSSARLTPNGTTHATISITPTVTNTMIVSSISFLSSSTFGNPSGIAGITERLDVAAPPPSAAIGTTLQMSTAPWATTTATGASQAVAASFADTGVGHLMALKPSNVDLAMVMTRSGPLIPGGSASYTLTVNNNGPGSESGPLTVVDTLPVGLTYASFSGSGWTCGAAGQVVTCTRPGALAAGATAPALVLNVNVDVGASGTLTNTATVSGIGGDGNLANNTAVDSYTIPIQSYAYYAMDEASWSGTAGEVIDSSGNNRHGTALGGITTFLTPASGLKGDTCRGTNIPDNNATATIEAVDTAIDINSIGNAGTISFWYRSRLSWNAPGNSNNDHRTLFDATPAGGNGEFWFVLRKNGRLRFRLDNAGNNRQTVNTGTINRPAGTWVHVAATWNFTSNTMCVFVDGVSVACRNNANVTSSPNYSTLYTGDNRGFYTNNVNRGNSADGDIDELRIYSSELTAADITADMNAAHSCVAVDHFAIDIGAAAASTCAAKSITITAQDALNATVTGYSGTINITTSSNHGDWSQPTITGTLINGTADDGAASYTFVAGVAGDNGVKELNLTNHHADDLTVSVVDSTLPATLSTSATINFRDNAFVITPDPIQVAGRDQAMSVAMWRRDLTTGDCAIATTYTGAKPLDAWLTLDIDHPAGATAPTIGALTLPSTAPPVNPASNNLSLTFTSGEATFDLATSDVGKYVLNLRDDTRSFASAVDILGGSATLTTRPFALYVTVPGNPGANTPGGPVFTSAGTNFTTTVRGVLWQGQPGDDDNNDGLPDAGANLADNAAALRYAWATTLSAVIPFTPATPADAPPGPGVAGTLDRASGGSTVVQAVFSGGSATTADWRYSEVGSFTIQAAASNYLNSAGVNLSSNTEVVGRFNPAHYAVTAPSITPACVSTFTYARQPFTGTMTIQAQSALNAPTQNFQSGYDTLDPTTELPFRNSATLLPYDNTIVSVVQDFSNGPTGEANLNLQFRWDMLEQDAVVSTVELVVTTDEVTAVSGSPVSIGTTDVRHGRLQIQNAFGSELLDLNVPMTVQTFASASGYTTETVDGCTTLLINTLKLSNVDDPGSPIDAPGPIIIGTGAQFTTANLTNPTLVGGDAGLFFDAPDAGGDGYVDITVDLTALPWLKFDWDATPGPDDPAGRATFGVYKGNTRHIYLRERY